VLADQVLDEGFRLGVERVVGRAHVGELGVASAGRDGPRVEQRVFRRDDFERAVRVPETVADGEEPPPIVPRVHAIVLVEIGDVGERRRQAVLVRRAQAGPDRVLDLPQAPGEGELLLVAQRLIVEHEHGVAVHAVVDPCDLLLGERLGQVDAVDLGGEAWTDLAGLDGHSSRLLGSDSNATCSVTRGGRRAGLLVP
jgi:hypothetical protein